MKEEDQLLTVDEVARSLTVSKTTLWRMLGRGELPVVKIGKRPVRVRRSDLDAYINSRRQAVEAQAKSAVDLRSEVEQDNLAEELAQFLYLEKGITNITRSRMRLSDLALMDLREKIREELNVATKIAREFGPSEITIGTGMGFPPRISVSFTWQLPSDNRGEDMP